MNRPILRLSIFLAFFMSASMSLYAQDVKLYISKKGSTDTSITSIETCKGETVFLKFEPKGLIQSYAFEIYDGVKWSPMYPYEAQVTLFDPWLNVAHPVNPKNNITYRVNYFNIKNDQNEFSNSVTIKIKNCTVK